MIPNDGGSALIDTLKLEGPLEAAFYRNRVWMHADAWKQSAHAMSDGTVLRFRCGLAINGNFSSCSMLEG